MAKCLWLVPQPLWPELLEGAHLVLMQPGMQFRPPDPRRNHARGSPCPSQGPTGQGARPLSCSERPSASLARRLSCGSAVGLVCARMCSAHTPSTPNSLPFRTRSRLHVQGLLRRLLSRRGPCQPEPVSEFPGNLAALLVHQPRRTPCCADTLGGLVKNQGERGLLQEAPAKWAVHLASRVGGGTRLSARALIKDPEAFSQRRGARPAGV